MSSFYLSSDREDLSAGKLKAYSSTVKNGRAVIRLEVEVTNLDELGYVLRDLEDLRKAHAAPKRKAPPAPKPAPRAIGRQKVLALPAPDEDPLP